MAKALLRVLAFIIDAILIYFPSILLLQVVFGLEFKMADIVAQLFMVLYFAIAGSAFGGKTVGKFFSKQRTVYMHDHNDLAIVGLREFPKMLYFIPHFGFVFTLLSVGLFIWKKTTLHDWIGGSHVLMDVQEKVGG
ncbi:RDD family protein [Lacticigenium naphthae]|uniref:RDD family protein n=1 Tax=Lacticigenium naphthae TaxID=515351 RepID=UPI0003FF5000|nr:RDD family protein [Lacticigenium naphthae]